MEGRMHKPRPRGGPGSLQLGLAARLQPTPGRAGYWRVQGSVPFLPLDKSERVGLGQVSLQ